MKNPFEIYTSYVGGRARRQLDWEESALASKVEGFFDEERQGAPQLLLWLLLALVFLGAFSRVFYLQIIRGSEYRILSEDNRVRKQTLLAPRGAIKDRNGEILARNTASFSLVAVPFDFPKESFEEELVRLSEVFGLTSQELETIHKYPKNSFQIFVVRPSVSTEQSILFETRAQEFAGFFIQKIPIREYVEPKVFSHVLGYTGLISESDLARVDTDKYDTRDFIGRNGIEEQYEEYLHGHNGDNQVEVDATGRLLRVLGENPPEPGNVAILNIDKELQSRLYSSLMGKGSGRKAAAVAMNPKTGEVLALVSTPGFDNNMFARGITSVEYTGLLSDKLLPLFNRALAGTYPPGSTVKPMVAAAALDEGLVNENTTIVDRGVLVIPNEFNPQIAYNFYGWKRDGLGAMNARSAIAQSSDIYFYTVAGGHPSSHIEGLGAEKLAEWYRRFNLGKPTGIDVPGEKSGLVADPEWKAEYFKDDAILRKWYLGDTYHIGIGQGDMLTTPLQVSLWTAIIANNGVGYVPRVLREIQDESGTTVFRPEAKIAVQNIVSESSLKIVQEGMRETILSGSGRQLSTLPITSAGKTGTSQFDGADPSRTHAWFTAYAPFENPEIVITVLVEAGGEGHSVAVPVVKDALLWWAENRYNK